MSLAIKIIIGIIAFLILIAGVVSIAALVLLFVHLKTGGDVEIDIDLKDKRNAE